MNEYVIDMGSENVTFKVAVPVRGTESTVSECSLARLIAPSEYPVKF